MVRSLFYVLILLLLYFIIQFIFFPTTPNRLLAKQICIAPSGCRIEMDTGFCPKCVEVDEQPIIKEEKVVVEKKPIVKISPKKKPVAKKIKPIKPKSWKGTLWRCRVGCFYAWWDDADNYYDEDGNLVSNTLVYQSKPKRDCSQKWECIVPPCDWIDENGCLIGD